MPDEEDSSEEEKEKNKQFREGCSNGSSLLFAVGKFVPAVIALTSIGGVMAVLEKAAGDDCAASEDKTTEKLFSVLDKEMLKAYNSLVKFAK